MTLLRLPPIKLKPGQALACAALCLLGLLSGCVPDVVRHNEAGNQQFEQGAYEPALDDYRLAQVAEPDVAAPYYNAANAYNRLSQVEAALAQTQQALKTADPSLAAQAWYNLGNAYFDAQQWQPAIEAYKESLRLQAGDPDAKHNLELALQHLQEQQAQQQQQNQQSQDQQDKDQQQQQDQQQSSGSDQQNSTPQPQAGGSPTPEGSDSAQNQAGQSQATPQPGGQAQEGQAMTEEQAMQLLRALLGNSQTLQEHLQKLTPIPAAPPKQDW